MSLNSIKISQLPNIASGANDFKSAGISDGNTVKADVYTKELTDSLLNDKVNKLMTPVLTYILFDYNIDSQSGSFSPDDELVLPLDIENAVLRVTAVNDNAEITALEIVNRGKSSYEFDGEYVEMTNNNGAYVVIECITDERDDVEEIDMQDLLDLHTELDAYTRNNFYSKTTSDNRFQQVNSSATITQYAGENQLQTVINSIQKQLRFSNNSATEFVTIYINGNQSAATIFVHGFGQGYIRLIFNGAYTITGRLYISDCSGTVEVTSASTSARGTITRLTFARVNQPRFSNILMTLDSNGQIEVYPGCGVVICSGNVAARSIEVTSGNKLRIQGNNVSVANLITSDGLVIASGLTGVSLPMEYLNGKQVLSKTLYLGQDADAYKVVTAGDIAALHGVQRYSNSVVDFTFSDISLGTITIPAARDVVTINYGDNMVTGFRTLGGAITNFSATGAVSVPIGYGTFIEFLVDNQYRVTITHSNPPQGVLTDNVVIIAWSKL
jgi:hypothetical protein